MAWSLIDKEQKIAVSKKGVPTGAGNLGFVRAKKFFKDRITLLATNADPGDDADFDGLPNTFDVDNDGDLLLDAVETAPTLKGPQLSMFTNLKVGIEESLNVNAMDITRTQIDDLVRRQLFLTFHMRVRGTPTIDVDCGLLVYCRPGTGTALMDAGPEQPAGVPIGTAWSTYDPNGNSFPNMWKTSRGWEALVRPTVPTTQIGMGDSYVVTMRGKTTLVFPSSLSFLFVTTPAVKSIEAGGTTTTLNYPSTVGTHASPIAVASTTPTFTVWRPQRPTIKGAETGDWRDIGHLWWGALVARDGVGDTTPYFCNASDMTPLSSSLTEPATSRVGEGDPLFDTAADAAPDPARTIQFSLDIASCLARYGHAAAGAAVTVDIEARNDNSDNAAQRVSLQLP